MSDREKNQASLEKYEFRSIKKEEADQAVEIEYICFPPNEVCPEDAMRERIAQSPEMFLVAVDKKTGKLAGFINGIGTDEGAFRDDFFTTPKLNNLQGENSMILGLDVLPEYRNQGLARELMSRYLVREKARNRKVVFLTCLEPKVKMYEKFGFVDRGLANSAWGGEEWHEMSYTL